MNIITTENITEKLKENKIMFIQFWAEWCGPCRALMPVIDKLEDEFNDIIGRCNTDENQELAQKYNIRGIPSILIFKDGEEIERLRGESKTFYSDKLKYYLSAV